MAACAITWSCRNAIWTTRRNGWARRCSRSNSPPRYELIKTISSSKQEVVCNAVLALPNGSNIAIDYSFYWSGSKVNMRYSVPLTGSGNPPPAPPAVPVR